MQKTEKGKLGTFAGVFTPSILTILGIILFLRLGFVVGQAGLGRAIVILLLANAISVMTSISLSAIATNLHVKGGGDYYLISRTLGHEFGGAIGMVLFAAQSVSVAFYCIGFGEVAATLMSYSAAQMPQNIAALAVLFLFLFAWLGADWATRFQYIVMGVLAAALISFFIGGILKWDTAMMVENWGSLPDGPGFWVVFAIFFPAVTGFTQGVSMSGDLKDPGRSLPMGTLMAVGLSILIYFLAAVILGATVSRDVLLHDYNAMQRVAYGNFLVLAGATAATLSSAMASFLGAPRILQSLAGDRIFPGLVFFAKGTGLFDNPRRGVLLTCVIAVLTIAMGNLNLIAPVVSMFFLISYGLLNYATWFEARTASPSFRPTFRLYHKHVSLAGAVACLGVMLAIDFWAGLMAILVMTAIYRYLKRRSVPDRWADSQRSYHLYEIRRHLLSAAGETEHPRDWRPNILLFSDDSKRRKPLLQLASWLQGESGFTTAVRVLEGRGGVMIKRREEAEKELTEDIRESEAEMFPLVLATPDFETGVHALIQSYGIGPVKPNTIVLNWLEQAPPWEADQSARELGRYLRMAFRQGCNIVLLNMKGKNWPPDLKAAPKKQRIDIWWWGDATSRLMLLFAYMLTRQNAWRNSRLRVLDAGYDKESAKTVADLNKTLSDIRISAEPEIVASVDINTIAAYSKDAALVFFPLRLKGFSPQDPFENPVGRLFDRLPAAVAVLAAKDIDLEAEPEEGKAAEIAGAVDDLRDARSKARRAEKEAEKARRLVEQNMEKLNSAAGSDLSEEEFRRLDKAARESRESARDAARRAAKMAVKADNREERVRKMGIEPPGEARKEEESPPGENGR